MNEMKYYDESGKRFNHAKPDGIAVGDRVLVIVTNRDRFGVVLDIEHHGSRLCDMVKVELEGGEIKWFNASRVTFMPSESDLEAKCEQVRQSRFDPYLRRNLGLPKHKQLGELDDE